MIFLLFFFEFMLFPLFLDVGDDSLDGEMEYFHS